MFAVAKRESRRTKMRERHKQNEIIKKNRERETHRVRRRVGEKNYKRIAENENVLFISTIA